MEPVDAGYDGEALLGLHVPVDHVIGLHDVEDPPDSGARRGLGDPPAVDELLQYHWHSLPGSLVAQCRGGVLRRCAVGDDCGGAECVGHLHEVILGLGVPRVDPLVDEGVGSGVAVDVDDVVCLAPGSLPEGVGEPLRGVSVGPVASDGADVEVVDP